MGLTTNHSTWRTWAMGTMCAVMLVAVGCGSQSGGNSGSPGGSSDTGPEIVVSEACEKACQNFMDKCGGLSTATQTECEIGCESSWSDEVAECVSAASSCGAVERCGSNPTGTSDTGTESGDTGSTDTTQDEG